MKRSVYLKHYYTIKNLIKKLGTDGADDYLRGNLSRFSKQVSTARKNICSIKKSILMQNNSAEKGRLEYDLNEAINVLNDLLEKLKTADEMYLCYINYIRKKSS
ncbi:hypothetical protein [Maledivibacter halophilus]|uniref:Uncharacterized protein n=1 Tax=Maledivibacter halophilus TaxID=36842 RepID=A0A1T5MTS9_9FIRM|nr:hypothetical protein [Maledivibacter halophilus]SKC91615.1 hypothetical protein SAMN02194393_05355 [Maledivibacter halophilus]